MINFIEKHGYKFFAFLFFGGIVVCWGAFYALSPYGHGFESTVLENYTIDGFDAFYFSVVTISSLGYGDFRPVGFGRVVAIIEVVYGLVIVALTVSKIASERTSILVRLVYTSDIERRVRVYIEENEKKNKILKSAVSSHDFEIIQSTVEALQIDFASYMRFFEFNHKDGYLQGRWAEKLFLKLLRSVCKSSLLIADIGKVNNLTKRERKTCTKALLQSQYLADIVSSKFDEKNIKGTSGHINKTRLDYTNYLEKLKSGDAHLISFNELSDELLLKVKNELPDKPWKKHIHKDIADKLRISKNLAHKAISKLEDSD